MRLFSLIATLTLIALVALTGCNSKELKKVASAAPTAPQQQQQADDHVRRITPEELKVEIAKQDVVIIDVRNEAAYKAGHIKGARLIPSTEILSHIDELPRDKMIVTYCSWPSEHTSASSVVNLKTKGIENAAAVKGGYSAMASAGFEIITGMDPNVSK